MPSAGRPILHVRCDDEMVEKIDQLAAGLNVDRSVMVRSLLAVALDESTKTAAAREVVMLLSSYRKRILAKFNDALQVAIDELAQTVERDS